MDQTMPKKSTYLPGLDGLRAVAILGIVLYHMFPGAVRGGYLGVTLFFVLSGFLLARTNRMAFQRGDYSVRSYYQRRVRRIYPALLWTIALTLLAMRLLLPSGLAGVKAEVASVLFGYQNWRLILQSQDYFTRISATTPFTHMWFLAVELQFYLIWPLLFLIYRAERGKGEDWGTIGVLVGFALVSIGEMAVLYYFYGDAARVYYGTDTRLHALLIGCAMGLAPERKRPLIDRDWSIVLFVVCFGALAALMVLLDGQYAATYYGLLALSSVLSAVLIRLCAREDLPFRKIFGFRPLAVVGRRSYEIYLCMYPVMYLLDRLRPVQDPVYLHLLEAAVTLALAFLIHALAQPNRWLAKAGQPSWKCLARPAFWAMLCAVGVGIWAAAPAQVSASGSDMSALEQLLEHHRASIEENAPDSRPDADGAPTAEPEPEPTLDPASVTMVGDSVMLGALPALQDAIPGCVVDAKVSRQVWDAAAVIDALEYNGQLGSVVIIALGTNSPFSFEQGQAIVDRLGPDRKIYWVNAFGTSLAWQDQSNEVIAAVAAANDNVTLVDWAAWAADHWDWFYSDGIHLMASGQSGYAACISDALGWVKPPPPEDPNAPPVVWDDEDGILVSDP